jgi:hypothetical protein
VTVAGLKRHRSDRIDIFRSGAVWMCSISGNLVVSPGGRCLFSVGVTLLTPTGGEEATDRRTVARIGGHRPACPSDVSESPASFAVNIVCPRRPGNSVAGVAGRGRERVALYSRRFEESAEDPFMVAQPYETRKVRIFGANLAIFGAAVNEPAPYHQLPSWWRSLAARTGSPNGQSRTVRCCSPVARQLARARTASRGSIPLSMGEVRCSAAAGRWLVPRERTHAYERAPLAYFHHRAGGERSGGGADQDSSGCSAPSVRRLAVARTGGDIRRAPAEHCWQRTKRTRTHTKHTNQLLFRLRALKVL